MSCPCYDAMDEPEPWSDDDTAWQGDIHCGADWEAFEALAGPEYWAYKALAEHPGDTSAVAVVDRLFGNSPEWSRLVAESRREIEAEEAAYITWSGGVALDGDTRTFWLGHE